MILLRALLNGVIGLVALIAVLTGCDHIVSAISPDGTKPALVAWVLGGAAALAVLLAIEGRRDRVERVADALRELLHLVRRGQHDEVVAADVADEIRAGAAAQLVDEHARALQQPPSQRTH